MGRGFSDIVYKHFGPDKSYSRTKFVLEFMIYFVGFLGTIFALVQGYKIWFTGNVGGISVTQWMMLALFIPFWILYGMIQKKRSLIMTYFVWLVVIILVIIGIMVRG